GLISMIVALFCSLWFYGSAGAFLLPYVSSKEIAHLCGFLIVFLGVLIAGAIIGVLFSRLVKAAGLGLFDRILGAGFGAVRGLLFAVALILEKTLIARAVERTDGNRSAASKLLGIHRNTLQRKIIEYKLGEQRPRRKPARRERASRRRLKTG